MRWYKSAWLCAPAAILIVFTTLPAQTAPAGGADEAQVRALVKTIYARYNHAIGHGPELPPFSPSTAALYEQYDSLTRNDDFPELSGFDHYCECQDFDEKQSRLLKVDLARVAPDLIDATARYVVSADGPQTTRIRFQKTDSWKVHDIFWSAGGSLRASLTQTIAKHGGAAEASLAQKPATGAAPTRMSATQQSASSPPAMAVPAASACGNDPRCVEVSSFVATVTDVRESTTGNYNTPIRLMAVTLRFRNTTGGPLALGYVANSGVITDDRGNRYTTDSRRIRGIGEVGAGVIDPKFVLRAGESADTRFEFAWQPGGALIGTHPVIDLAVREIESLAGNQWRLGREYALHFSGFGGPPAVEASAVSPSAPAGSLPATSSATDVCAKKVDCYSTPTFVAEITRMSQSENRDKAHIIQYSVRFRNLTAQPLALAHTQWSTSVVDDQGNRYTSNWTYIKEVTGMGFARGAQSDQSFVLQPGQDREATYTALLQPTTNRLGSTYNIDFAVEELELFPGNQVRSARQYAVGFHDVKIGRWRGLRNLIDIRIGKQ